MTEKLVSLVRCSLANNMTLELTAKIRHFYDLHFLSQDAVCQNYLQSENFKEELAPLFLHDQQSFCKPD